MPYEKRLVRIVVRATRMPERPRAALARLGSLRPNSSPRRHAACHIIYNTGTKLVPRFDKSPQAGYIGHANVCIPLLER